MVRKIISGGQTGADRAGLDVALALGLEVGGHVSKGRRTEEGPLSDEQMAKYGLVEHYGSSYQGRTALNVFNSEGTVIFGDIFSPGSDLTLTLCRQSGKPFITNPTAEELREWIEEHSIVALNVAGNRESRNPGIYQRTYDLLMEALR